MIKQFLLSIFLIHTISHLNAQFEKYTAATIHAHNDYEKKIPFWDAYFSGAGSIEADIFLADGKLLVAHERNQLAAAPSLEQLYLKPMDSLLKKYNGTWHNETKRNIQWLIDIKTLAEPTLKVLDSILHYYPSITNSKHLKIVISGNRPPSEKFYTYPNYIYFDGIPTNQYSKEALAKIALMSDNFKKYSSWNGKGIVTAAEKTKLDSIIQLAHQLNKPMRFWNAPDTINAWYQFMHLGVDYINTDYPAACGTFMKQLPNRVFKNNQPPYKIYQPTYKTDAQNKSPKNIILLIGDGMGMAQLYAGYTANYGNLHIFKMKQTGLSKTSSYDSYITDSAPGSTAFSSGEKTNNRSVGVDHTGNALPLLPSILKKQKGMKSGIISSGDFTDATPADFYAHQAERNDSKKIANDLEKSDVDIIMGAGNGSVNGALNSLLPSYKIVRTLSEVQISAKQKQLVADPTAWKSMLTGRGEWLGAALDSTINILSTHPKGFLIVAEGAQIDYGGHNNNLAFIAEEVMDFDKTVARALQYADKNGETLVIVTADHETGGLTLLDGKYEKGMVSGQFATNDHTATPVPVFAYGPMSHLFNGVYENTEIFHKILAALGVNHGK